MGKSGYRTIRDALLKSEARFKAISDASPLGIFVSDRQGNCNYTNAAYQKICGLDLEQSLGARWSAALHPDDRQRVLEKWPKGVCGESAEPLEVRFLRPDGSMVWARLNGAAMISGGELQGYVQTVEDITERKAIEADLSQTRARMFEEKERAQVTLNSIGDAVMSTDIQGRVTYLNQAAETMTGWSRGAALGRPLPEVFNIINGETRQKAANPAQRVLDEDRIVGLAADSVLVRQDGFEAAIKDSAAPIHNQAGRVTGAVIVFHDVSESRAMALKMSYLAQHDFLTALPNRVLLTERLSQAMGIARRHRKQVALLFLDLDNFKEVNDSLGHGAGDKLLQSVAGRLAECVRTTDTVCRQGGDEFVVLLAEIELPQDAARVADKLLAACARPHLVDGHELHITLSIGISVFPDDSATVDAMMQNADAAMYHAKAAGRNRALFYAPLMSQRPGPRR